MLYFTSDTHLGHANIIKYCNRPFSSVEEMNSTIISNWNSIVKEEDIVFHLGDVAFGKAAWDLVSQLKGHKILVKGNHDWRVSNSKILNSGFEKIYTESVIINLFSVQHGLNWRVELSHTPLWEKRKEYNIYNLCGHVHDNWKQKSNILNVGIDVWWFKPISVFTLLEYFNSVLWHEADTFKGGL